MTQIPAELEPAAVGGMVTDSKYVKDRVKNKTQEEVNADTEERVSTLEESVGTGGSVDERIAVEKNRAEQAEGVLDGKIATEKQRAEGVEGGLNTRLQTVEQLAEISVGGGDIGIGTAADFESDDPEDKAKVPTIGAVLGNMDDTPIAGSNKFVKSGGVALTEFGLVGVNSPNELFDKTEAVLGIKLANNTGAEADVPTYFSTPYIPVSGGENIYVTSVDNNNKLWYYDAEKNCLGMYRDGNVYTLGSNVRFVRTCDLISNIKQARIGLTVQSNPIDGYLTGLKSAISSNTNDIATINNTIGSINQKLLSEDENLNLKVEVAPSTNLFDPTTIITGVKLDSNTGHDTYGKLIVSVDDFTTSFIPFDKNKTYYINSYLNRVFFYAADKTPIGDIHSVSSGKISEIDSTYKTLLDGKSWDDVAFARFYNSIADLENTYLTTITPSDRKQYNPIEKYIEQYDREHPIADNTVIMTVATYNTGDFTGTGYEAGSNGIRDEYRKALSELGANFVGLQEDVKYFGQDQNPATAIYGMFKHYNRRGNSGDDGDFLAFGSDYPVNNVQNIFYTWNPEVTSTTFYSHTHFIAGEISIGGKTICVITFHLDWRDMYARREQARQIREFAKQYDYAICAGDCNPEYYIDRTTGDGHDVSDEDWAYWTADGFTMANKGYFGTFRTLYNKDEPCDNIFILGGTIKSVKTLIKTYMNDHYPLISEIVF